MKITETYVAVINFVVLGIFDDLLDLLGSTSDIGASTTDKDDVLGRCIASFCTELDRQCLVLTDDTTKAGIQCKSKLYTSIYSRIRW